MNRIRAWLAVTALVAVTILGLILPPIPLAAFAVAAVVALRSGRRTFLVFAFFTLGLNALLLGWLVPGETAFAAGLPFSKLGLTRGLLGGLRLVAVTGANLAVLSRLGLQAVLDGLHLPPRSTAFLGAVLLAAHDLGRDAQRLALAQRLDGRWPRNPLRRLVAAARMLGPLMVLALRRGRTRREALRLAGHDTPPQFAALVALTALAAASRLALLALPNLKPTFAIVFLGGFLFGPIVGAASAVLAMAFTDLLLTGLSPAPFANVPAMALVGAMGGLLRGWERTAPATLRAAAAACGILATAVFSLSADILTWLIVPEFRTTPGALAALVWAGLAFNVVPAAANAMLFAVAVGPVARAVRAAGLAPPVPSRSPLPDAARN